MLFLFKLTNCLPLGNDGKTGVNVLNFATNLDLVFLLIKDTPTNDDYMIVQQIKLLNKYNYNTKLIVVKTYFDKYDRSSEESKSDLKKQLYEYLELDEYNTDENRSENANETPFFCVSLKEENQNEDWNQDFKCLIGDSYSTSFWYTNGLSREQKEFCEEYRTPLDEKKLDEINKGLKTTFKNLLISGGSALLSILPIAGDVYDNKILRKIIRQHVLKLHLRGEIYQKRIEFLEKNLANQEIRRKLNEIKKRYNKIDSSCKDFIDYVLKKALPDRPLLHISDGMNTFKDKIQKFFEKKKETAVNSSTFVKQSVYVIQSAGQAVVTLSDDVAKLVPTLSKALSKVFLVLGIGLTAVFSGYSAYYAYAMLSEIRETLIEDARFLYLIEYETNEKNDY